METPGMASWAGATGGPSSWGVGHSSGSGSSSQLQSEGQRAFLSVAWVWVGLPGPQVSVGVIGD